MDEEERERNKEEKGGRKERGTEKGGRKKTGARSIRDAHNFLHVSYAPLLHIKEGRQQCLFRDQVLHTREWPVRKVLLGKEEGVLGGYHCHGGSHWTGGRERRKEGRIR